MRCARGNDQLTLGNVEVARYLLSRGASIDKKTLQGQTALLASCYTSGGTVAEMVELLLSAGANPNARNKFNRTALSAHVTYAQIPSVECVTALLRAGASLDRVYGKKHLRIGCLGPILDEERPDPESFWPAMRACRRHSTEWMTQAFARAAPRGAAAPRPRDAGPPRASSSHARRRRVDGGRRLPRAPRRQRRRLERALVLARCWRAAN